MAEGLIQGRIDESEVDKMRQRIGYPNPTVRHGFMKDPWNITATQESFRRFAICNGDDNPLFTDADYARNSRWGGPIAPLTYEWSTGVKRHRVVPPDVDKITRTSLKGVQLFHSGGENFYYKPIREGTKLYVAKWVDDVQLKPSKFAGKSVIVTNGKSWWDDDDTVHVNGVEWYIHAERQKSENREKEPLKLASYTDEQLAEIEAGYDAEYRRGADTLYIEDVKVGDVLPTMIKGPLTVTDQINNYMGAGWLDYGNPPYRLAYENRKKLRGFYIKNEYGAWDTLQRIHWDKELAAEVGVPSSYDIGPMRELWLGHYLNNYAGDDAWVYRLRFEFRAFNFVGDTTWISGTVTDVRVDDVLGPLIEVAMKGVSQRGQENIRGTATILVASRKTGLAVLPASPKPTKYRS